MPGMFGPTTASPAFHKPLRQYDARMTKAQTPAELGKILNETFARTDRALQPFLLSASMSWTVQIPGKVRIGMLVKECSNGTATMASAEAKIACNSIVVQQISGASWTIAPMACVNITLLNVTVSGDFQPVFLGNHGSMTSTEPTLGFVQPVGWIRFYDATTTQYRVLFQPTAPGWLG